jgi:hypothetical protein
MGPTRANVHTGLGVMGQVCDSIKPPDLLVFALNTFNHFFSFVRFWFSFSASALIAG